MAPLGRNDLVVVLGPTAAGKTSLAVALCRALDGELISADSRQVYRGMDIGTGKDLAEYGAVRYHLIDICEPGEDFHLFAFQRAAFAAIADIRARGKQPVLCGGTGLYLDAVLRGYRMVEAPENPELRAHLAALSDSEIARMLCEVRPQQHNTTDLRDRARLIRALEIALAEAHSPEASEPPPFERARILGLTWPRPELRQRIAERLRQRLGAGMIEEVQALRNRGIARARLEYFGLEYRYISRYLDGELDRAALFTQLHQEICHFAKRQETWFRRMERQGHRIDWLDPSGDLVGQARDYLGGEGEAREGWL